MGDFEKVIAWNKAVGPTFKTLRLRAERAEAERDEARAEVERLHAVARGLTEAIHDQASAGHPVSPRVQIAYTAVRAALAPVPHEGVESTP